MQRYHIRKQYFEYIDQGVKEWEGRPIDSRMAESSNVGDIFEIYCDY